MQVNEKEAKLRDEGEAAVVATIAAMTGNDRAIGERLHPLIKASAPELVPKTWYGMPSYANKEGKVICFFRPAQRFNERYMQFGFSDLAKIDDGDMWPIAFTLKELNAATEERIAELVKKAVS